MIDASGTITMTNSHVQGVTVKFRPRFKSKVEAGGRMEAPQVMKKDARLREWLRQAKQGARICYYVGNLAFDREHIVDGKPTEEARRISRLADLAREAFDEGLVVLCQITARRESGLRAGYYSYVAVRTHKPFQEKQHGQAA